jgi:hypothetical protein
MTATISLSGGKSFGPARVPVLQWRDEGQSHLRGRASYRLAGCRCLT